MRSLGALNRHAEALADVDKYLEVNEGDSWGLITKANVLSDYREFQAAVDILEQLDQGDPFASGLLGTCRNRLADPRGAITALEIAVAGSIGCGGGTNSAMPTLR
jgi:hypothetical protein